MTSNLKLIALLSGALLVAACDDSGSDDGNTATGIDTFGSAFVAMFNAGSNDEPVNAQSVRITVNPTADPFNP